MERYKVIGRKKYFYILDNGDYHILETSEELEIGDVVTETADLEYFCNGQNLYGTMQYEGISKEKAIQILSKI